MVAWKLISMCFDSWFNLWPFGHLFGSTAEISFSSSFHLSQTPHPPSKFLFKQRARPLRGGQQSSSPQSAINLFFVPTYLLHFHDSGKFLSLSQPPLFLSSPPTYN